MSVLLPLGSVRMRGQPPSWGGGVVAAAGLVPAAAGVAPGGAAAGGFAGWDVVCAGGAAGRAAGWRWAAAAATSVTDGSSATHAATRAATAGRRSWERIMGDLSTEDHSSRH